MSVAVTRAAEGFPRRAFTVEDVARMIDAGVLGEDEKFELVEGAIVMMPAKGIAHERIKSPLTIAVARALPDYGRQRARHLGTHRPKCRRMVVHYRARAAGGAHHPSLPRLSTRLDQTD
jgi:hypothetical protein